MQKSRTVRSRRKGIAYVIEPDQEHGISPSFPGSSMTVQLLGDVD